MKLISGQMTKLGTLVFSRAESIVQFRSNILYPELCVGFKLLAFQFVKQDIRLKTKEVIHQKLPCLPLSDKVKGNFMGDLSKVSITG